MSSYHFDYETASANKFKHGAPRYASDPTTRILMFAISRDGETPLLWRFTDPDTPEATKAWERLHEAFSDPDALIYAHNAEFEIHITNRRAELDLGMFHANPDLEQWRCTQAMCRRAAIPGSLKEAGKFLKLPSGKDTKGRALITIFSKMHSVTTLSAPEGVKVYDKSTKGRKAPNRKSLSPIFGWDEGKSNGAILAGEGTHHDEILWDWLVNVDGTLVTVREAWDMFCDYCRQDVVVEMGVHERLQRFELTGPILESFQFNLRMNQRGLPVNVTALRNASKLIEQYQARMFQRFKAITGLKPTQIMAYGDWMAKRGYWADNMQADTIDEAYEIGEGILTDEAYQSLSIFRLLNYAALKKIPTMLEAADDDDRVRGTMLWHGARTGRATGQVVQPHNMKKATMDTTLAYQMICDGCSLEDLCELWESPLEVIASCARHFIQFPDCEVNDADFVGVEARIAPWLVDDEAKLESILSGVDQYKAMATRVFGVPYDEVTKLQRTISKPVELGCQFGVGGKGLQNGLAAAPYYVDLPLKECKRIVKVYRDAHPLVTGAWKEIENAAKAAITNGAKTWVLNGRVLICRKKAAGVRYLVIKLPSGRELFYPHPRIIPLKKKYTKEEMLEEPWKAERKFYIIDEIQFWGTRPNTSIWGWVGTWGSRLFENIVQSVGADLLDEGCINAEKKGFDIFLIVHDQALCPHKGGGQEEADLFGAALCGCGSWADTFPLEADSSVAPYYRKD